MAKELKVGDMVRVYSDEGKFVGQIRDIGSTFVYIHSPGVPAVHDKGFYPEQCRRLVKKRKEKPPERVEQWCARVGMGDGYTFEGCHAKALATSEASKIPGARLLHLTELRPGESICPVGHVPVSRESLAKAWDAEVVGKSPCYYPMISAMSSPFKSLSKALGLGTEGKKE